MNRFIFALLVISLPLQAGAVILSDGDGASGNSTPITINPGSSGGGGGLIGLSNYKESAAGRTINVNSPSVTSCAQTITFNGVAECSVYRVIAGLTGVVSIASNGNTATFSGYTKTATTNTKYGLTGAGGTMSCSIFNASATAKQYVGSCSARVGGIWTSLSVAVTIAADGATISSNQPSVSGAYRGVGGSGDYQ